MRRIPDSVLAEMANELSDHDRDEMAIPSYRHRNPALRWMAWRRVEVVAARLVETTQEQGMAATLVDFGCGTGVLFETGQKAAKRVIGVDLVLAPARALAERWELGVELMTPNEARDLIDADSVDIIVAAEVLEHVEPLEETLALFQRWLRPEGRLVVSLPTENRLYQLGRRLAGFHGHYHHDDAESIDRKLRDSGFRRLSRSTIPLPGPLAVYWVLEYSV